MNNLGLLAIQYIGNVLYYYTIYRVPPCACLESDTFKVDFGTQVCEHQLISQQFYIKNSGDLEGCFVRNQIHHHIS